MEDIDYSFKLDHYRKFTLTLNNPAFRLRNKAVRMNCIYYHIAKIKGKIVYLRIRRTELVSILIQRHFYMYEANYNHILEDYKNGIYPERLHKYDFYNEDSDYDYNMKFVIRGNSPTIILTHSNNSNNNPSLGKIIYRTIDAVDVMEEVICHFRDDGRIQEMPVEEMVPFLNEQTRYKYFKKELKFLKEPKYESSECMVCSEDWSSLLKLNLICGHSICNSCMNNLVSQKCPACRMDLVSYERELKPIELIQYELEEECPLFICDHWFEEDIAVFANHMLNKIGLKGIYEMDYETLIDYEDAKFEDLNKIIRILYDTKVYVLCSG